MTPTTAPSSSNPSSNNKRRKDLLRQSCLERVRKRRRRRRRSSEEDDAYEYDDNGGRDDDEGFGGRGSGENGFDDDYDDGAVGDINDDDGVARRLLLEQMKRHNVVLTGRAAVDSSPSSPTTAISPTENRPNNTKAGRCDDYSESGDDDNGHCTMTEDEWIELLEEIENELEKERADDALLAAEDQIDAQRQEQLYFERQLDEYDRQQHEAEFGCDGNADAGAVAVLCPMCQEANLLATRSVADSGSTTTVTCPNHEVDGTCPFQLCVGDGDDNGVAAANRECAVLGMLREALRATYEQHVTDRECTNSLTFEIQPVQQHQDRDGEATTTSTTATLRAICAACRMDQPIFP